MSYHEDRFIDWLGQYDGQLGASPGDGLRSLRRHNERLKMIPNDQPARKQMIELMLSVLVNPNIEITKWESDFIASISDQFESKGNLSDKQCEILERIYDKV